MVGLSDIPCVGKIVDRISDATVDPLFRGFNYMFYYKDHVIVLDSKIQQLNTETDIMSRKVVEERDNGKTIIPEVVTWQTQVEDIRKSAQEFSVKYNNRSSWRCIQCMPIPKPISRIRLGREAVQTARRVTELTDCGRNLLANDVAYLPPVPNVPTTDLTAFGEFKSRKDAYERLWKELVTEGGPPVVGIYGMPGVGKTRMAEQIWKESMEKKIFNKVARAVVGSEEVVDVIKLQNQIAGGLNCHFESQDDVQSRASQLKNSIMNVEKVLIILDDVWSEIALDTIGIPLGDGNTSKGLKILITSREDIVCLQNNCENPVKITILTVDEAWDLFRNTVVNDKYNFPDESLAKKVCKKCAGLPLLIHAVGKALQHRSQNSWNDALGKLEKGQVRNIPKINPGVYACVELSIDALPVVAKSCLFLCSLFPEDAEISIRRLIQIATGTQLVPKGEPEGEPEGECSVRAMVDILRSSSLLLDCKEDHKIKLHDLIREVARSIAIEKYSISIVRCGSWFPDNAEYFTRKFVHLQLEENDFHFPDNLVCPDVHNLWLQCNRKILQLSDGFFCKFANLRFLLIEGISEMKFSLQPLGNLRTLILDNCDMTCVTETNVIFFPEKLETLCFWNCQLPVPLDLTNLKHLKKLEIQWRWTRKVQRVRNTISSLEELRFQRTLSDYHISGYLESSGSFKRSIELYGDDVLELEGLNSLIERAEEVRLESCRNINVGSIYNSNREAFEDLRNLHIEYLPAVEYVARITSGEIQHQRSFSKLTILTIVACRTMKYVFSKCVAKCLVQLQELRIENCQEMEAIVINEGTSDGDDDIINFSHLKSLQLIHLPSIKSFYMDSGSTAHNSAQPLFDQKVAFPSLEVLDINDRGAQISLSEIWGKNENGNVVSSFPSFFKLKRISLIGCTNLKTAIPLSMLNKLTNLQDLVVQSCHSMINVFQHSSITRDLINLQTLEVMYCDSMRVIIGGGEELEAAVLFPKLTTLRLYFLPRLTSFWRNQSGQTNSSKIQLPNLMEDARSAEPCGTDKRTVTLFHLKSVSLYYLPKLKSCFHGANYEFHMPALEAVTVNNCGISTLFSLSAFESLHQLQVLEIWNCDLLEEIVEDERSAEPSGTDKRTVTLFHLKSVSLKHMPKLKSCFHGANYEFHMPALEQVEVNNCGISTLFSLSAFESLHQLQVLEIWFCNLLEEIVEDARSAEPSGTDKRTVTLFHLKSVSLIDLPKLKSCFHGANYEFHMPALEEVTVHNCGISTLFSCSVFKTLQQLKQLWVTECRLLEEIVEDAKGDETSDTNDNIITLPQMTTVSLQYLPKLKSFSSNSSYAFKMTVLQSIKVIWCPRIEFFTSLETSTPLIEVEINGCKMMTSDPNECVRAARENKTTTPLVDVN